MNTSPEEMANIVGNWLKQAEEFYEKVMPINSYQAEFPDKCEAVRLLISDISELLEKRTVDEE
jgi:hypothetical protein